MTRPGKDIFSQRDRFEAVYRETRIPLLGYLARRTQCRDDAADLLAEVYLVAWRRIDAVPPGDEARLWLFGVARKVLANHKRRVRTATGLASALQADLRLLETDSGAESDPRVDGVRAALDQLSDRDREVLMLSAWEGLAPAEIARVLGRPAGLVRVQLHRAHNRLRDKMGSLPDVGEEPPDIGVREPRRPLGPGPASTAQLE